MTIRKANTAGAQEEGFIYARDRRDNKIKRILAAADLQLGTLDLPCELHVLGRTSFNTKETTIVAGGEHTIEDHITYNVISPSGVSGSVSVYLPGAPRVGQTVVIKDAGNAGSVQIVVYGANGTRIDGAVSCVIPVDYGSMTFHWLGSSWSVSSSNMSRFVMVYGALSTTTATTLTYLYPGGSSLATTSNANALSITVPHAGTIYNLQVQHNTAGVGGTTINYRVLNDLFSSPGGAAASTALQVDLSTAGFSASDTSTYVKVAKGDRLYLKAQNNTAITTTPVGLYAAFTYSCLINSV